MAKRDYYEVLGVDRSAAEAEIKKAVKAKEPFKRTAVSKAEALEIYKHEPDNVEMIRDVPDGTFAFYRHGDCSER